MTPINPIEGLAQPPVNLPTLSLDEFIAALNQFNEPPGLEALQNLLGRLDVSDNEMAELRKFSKQAYQRNLVADGDNFEVLMLCFEAGQRTPIHDHAGSACGVKVLEGTATETNFDATSEGWLFATESNELAEGGVVGSVDMDIHQLSNLQSGQRLVTLHIYSPPLGEVGNYSIIDNSVQRVRAKRVRAQRKRKNETT